MHFTRWSISQREDFIHIHRVPGIAINSTRSTGYRLSRKDHVMLFFSHVTGKLLTELIVIMLNLSRSQSTCGARTALKSVFSSVFFFFFLHFSPFYIFVLMECLVYHIIGQVFVQNIG